MKLKEGGHTFTFTGAIVGLVGYFIVAFILAIPFIFG